MPVHLIDRQNKPALITAGTIRRRATKLLEALKRSDAELSLLLTNDEEIKELNAAWRQKDKPTDVLSFPQDSDEILGDVAISVETALRQSADEDGWARAHAGVEGDWTLLDETTLLLIHGVLHLLGHDHHKKDEAKKMRAEEKRLFALLAKKR